MTELDVWGYSRKYTHTHTHTHTKKKKKTINRHYKDRNYFFLVFVVALQAK